MIWKGVGILAGSAGAMVLIVLGFAQWVVPNEPDFSDSLEDSSIESGGTLDFVPTAIGGQLEVSGTSEATITVDRPVDGPTYGLGNSTSRIFFEANPLTITQMSHDGLAFFPDPEDCEFTIGQHNDESGLAAVEVNCLELVDIRGNGTISLAGLLALPADMVLQLHLPETGGSVTVGGEEWELSGDAVLFIDPEHQSDGPGLFLHSDDAEASLNLEFSYDQPTETLALTTVFYRGGISELEPDQCSAESEHLATVNPQVSVHQVHFRCDSVQISSLGAVSIDGSAVFERVFSFEP